MEQAKKDIPEKKFSLLDESKKIFESRFYDSFFVGEYGKLEGVRSERYGLPFSVVILHIDSFYGGQKVPPKKDLLEFLKKLVTTVLKVIRNCDVAGMLEDKRIVIILPHTDYFGALITIKKISKALEFMTTQGEPYASIIYSHANSPKDAKGYGELASFASKRISEIRESIWERMKLKNKYFWEVMALITEQSHKDFEHATFETGSSGALQNNFIQKINEIIVQEIARRPGKRGLLYIAAKEGVSNRIIRKYLEAIPKTSTRVYLVGQGGKDSASEMKNATTISINDARFENNMFTFYLNEDSAYALICKENWGEALTCFHTSDPYFVEGIITKFQRDYSLQEHV